jgi:hypothetical protein
VAQILKVSSAYTPPPPEGFVSPMLWGVKENVIERCTAAGVPKENISFTKETFTFKAHYPPSEFVDVFKCYYGPTMNAFEAAEKNNKAVQLQGELEALFTEQNTATPDGGTHIMANFLMVTVVR